MSNLYPVSSAELSAGYTAGCDDYVIKTYDIKTLVQRSAKSKALSDELRRFAMENQK